jgi:signal transduction histidine kinase
MARARSAAIQPRVFLWPRLRQATVNDKGDGRPFLDGQQNGTPESIRRAGFLLKCRVACFCVLIAAVIGALVAAVILEQRASALEGAESNAVSFSAVFEEQVRSTMDTVSSAMDLLGQRIEKEGAAFDLSGWARQVPELAASTILVSIVGAEGKLLATTLDPHPAPIDLSDREHFRVHRDNPAAGLFIGKPVRGRVSNAITIPVTKRIDKADGGFGGVLVFSLDPKFLTGLHRKIDLRQSGSVVLVGRDAVIRARFTSAGGLDSSVIGSSIPNSIMVAGAATASAGSYVQPSPIDNVIRIVHWRTVAGYPLIVTVGLGRDEALAAAARHARIVLVLGALAIALPLVLALMLNREIGLRVAREIALRREGETLRTANDGLTAQHRKLMDTSAALALERMRLTQANAELEHARRQAEGASGAKSSFLANMSHELRTPLNAIIGFAEIIRDRLFGDNPARYSECAADIQVSGVHLLRIINGVLDVAKIEAGKFVLHESVVSLDALANESLTVIRPQAATGEITLVNTLPEGGVHLRCDETRFKQILINLLSNAVKFTPPGGTVTLKAECEADGALRIGIIDTGIGMTAEEIASAFELFSQVDSTLARRFPGTGLGLPLAVQLAELHGATLELESAPNVGTTAWVRVPPARVINAAALAQAEADDLDRRITDRKPVTQVVFIYSDEARFETRTVDLSGTGVRIERIDGLAQGDRVRVEMGTQVAEGIVVWQDPTHIGVKFLDRRTEIGPDGKPVASALHDAA